jgi:hypothetical protein
MKKPTVTLLGRTFEFVKYDPTVEEVHELDAKYPNRALYWDRCLWIEITEDKNKVEPNAKED